MYEMPAEEANHERPDTQVNHEGARSLGEVHAKNRGLIFHSTDRTSEVTYDTYDPDHYSDIYLQILINEFFSDSQQPFALVFDFSALLGDNLN
jgi:hypothetical protein